MLRDAKFRVAMAWAIDREKCASLAWSDLADPGYGIFPEKGWPEAADPYYRPEAADTIGFDLEKARTLMDEAGYRDDDGDGVREDKQGEPITLRLWARDISPESQVQGKLITGWLQEIGLDIDYSVVDEGALGDDIWNYKGDVYAPDYDLALWDFMGYIDPGDSAACFTTDQIENYNEMCWSNVEYDEPHRGAVPGDGHGGAHGAAQAGAGRDVRRAADDRHRLPVGAAGRERREVGGLAAVRRRQRWNNFLDRRSYLELKPKVAETAGDEGGSSVMQWVVVGVVAFAGAAIVVALKRRGDGRAVEE